MRSARASTASVSLVEPKLWERRSVSSRGSSRTSEREAPAWGAGSLLEEETGVLPSPITHPLQDTTMRGEKAAARRLVGKIWVCPRLPWLQRWAVEHLSSSPRRTKKWLGPPKGQDAPPRTGMLATPGLGWARALSVPRSCPCCQQPGRGRGPEVPAAAPALTATVTMTTCSQVQ